jgi:DNA polymerase (family X)
MSPPLSNPMIDILGHPRGRIYNFRLGLSADWAKVFTIAAELDKAVEIDSYPDRQDLSLDLVKLARKGVPHLTRYRLARRIAARIHRIRLGCGT